MNAEQVVAVLELAVLSEKDDLESQGNTLDFGA
jgi:hypothetical protein